jgi:hypothetical protein
MGKHPLYNQTGLQKNNKSHVLYALANKQMELKQIQDEYEAKILKVKADLEAMEQVICLFDRDCGKTIKKLNTKSSNTKPRARNKHFINGECKKLVLSVMRTNTEQLTTSDISLKVQDLKKIDKSDNILNKNIQKIVVQILRALEKINIIEQIGKDGLSIIWKIKD